MGTELKTDILNPSDDTKETVNYVPNPSDISADVKGLPAIVQGVSGGIDFFTKIALHLDTDFTDSSSTGTVIESASFPTVNTDQPKFGVGSALFTNANWLGQPLNDSTYYNGANNGNYTLDLQLYPTSLANDTWLLFDRNGTLPTGALIVDYDADGSITMRRWNSTIDTSATGVITINTWHHIAIEFEGVITRLYVNGIKLFENNYNALSDNQWAIGRPSGSQSPVGYIDELRFSRVARYRGANFTSPIAPYDSTNTNAYEISVTEETSPTLTNKLYGRNTALEPIEISDANSRKNVIYDLGNTSGGASIDYDVNPATTYTATATAAITGWTFTNFPDDFPFKLHVTGNFDITYGTDGAGNTANQDGLKVFNVEYDGTNYQMTWENNVIDTTAIGGDLTITNGNLVIGTSGKGIDFSATANSSGTMTSELFDDYEEGTWTPVLRFGGTSTGITYTTQTGAYTKYGRDVRCNCNITLTSKGTDTGTLTIAGAPFTSGATGETRGYCSVNTAAATIEGDISSLIDTSGAAFSVQQQQTGILAVLTDADIIDTSIIQINITYTV